MTSIPKYDVAIVGGGLSGLSLSIQLSRQGYSVIVYEKKGIRSIAYVVNTSVWNHGIF